MELQPTQTLVATDRVAGKSVFVNLYNNMWNTNFALWQEGSWSERMRIWPTHEQPPNEELNLVEKSWKTRVPLLTGEADGPAGTLKTENSGLSVSSGGVLITAFGENPDGDGMLLRLWEQAGKTGQCKVKFPKGMKIKAVQPIDLRGNVIESKIDVRDGAFDFILKKYSPASFLLIP